MLRLVEAYSKLKKEDLPAEVGTANVQFSERAANGSSSLQYRTMLRSESRGLYRSRLHQSRPRRRRIESRVALRRVRSRVSSFSTQACLTVSIPTERGVKTKRSNALGGEWRLADFVACMKLIGMKGKKVIALKFPCDELAHAQTIDHLPTLSLLSTLPNEQVPYEPHEPDTAIDTGELVVQVNHILETLDSDGARARNIFLSSLSSSRHERGVSRAELRCDCSLPQGDVR